MAASVNTDEFVKGLQEFSQIAEQKATRQLRRISMKALSMIVAGTPVLTGCCRGNWIVSNGSLSRQFGKAKKDKSGAETVNAGLTRIQSATLGVDVLIENSCPYVFRLENGWSRQKPPGSMIRQPLAKLRTAIANGAK